jgi:uncharacterized membrane protein
MKAGIGGKGLLVLISLIFCSLLFIAHQVGADGRKGSKHQFEKTEEHRSTKDDHARKEDRGNETTGEMAAWIFGVANFPVAVSIILKALAKLAPLRTNHRDVLIRINRQQKKHLMKVHYWLNPVALGVALTHFLLSTCRSTVFPEWGLGILLVTVVLGLMMKFRLSPASMRQRVFRFHTSPVLLILAISILLIGHTIVD